MNKPKLLERYENQKARKSCEDFLALNDAGRLDLSTQTDMSMTSQSGNIDVKASVRNLTIKNVHGNIDVYGATIHTATVLHGNICLHDGAKILNASEIKGKFRNL